MLWKGLVAGAIGGAVASFSMNQAQAAMSRMFEAPAQPHGARWKGRQAQGWREQRADVRYDSTKEERANVKVAAAISHAVRDRNLAPEEKQRAGTVVHYAYGIGAGALYGIAAERWDDARAGQGSVFGAVLWLLSDEIGVPAMGVAKSPDRYPLRTHGMSLASHLVYGVTTEVARRALRRGVLGRG